jgi:hypothetical protein
MAAGAAEDNLIARAFLAVYATKNGIAVDMPPSAALKLPDLRPLVVLSDDLASDSDDRSKTPARTVATGGVVFKHDANDEVADGMSAGDKLPRNDYPSPLHLYTQFRATR